MDIPPRLVGHGLAAAVVTSPHMQHSLMLLEQEMYKIQLKIRQKEMKGKDMASDPSQVALPVLPVTAAKVTAFLYHESTCEKLKHGSRSETIKGSSLDKSHIVQHEHPQDHEMRTSLQKNAHIQAFDSTSRHNKSSRVKRLQAIKAAGTTFDLFGAEATAKE
ncbi:hypothetical protein HD554DRAFT_2168107 [Boletus coccyginus]|nr:hypothetical protein HD554DRAFT_2168107 [Boletus coccyginus]